MRMFLFSLVIKGLPKKLMSWVVGHIVQIRWPEPINALLNAKFAQYYGLNLREAELDIEEYRSISEVFTRRLKAGARPIGSGVVHPADSELTQSGVIRNTGGGAFLVQAKGVNYTLQGLLNHQDIDDFEGGLYATYYLCPTDYHRVHSPVDGEITGYAYNPGFLWPVNEWSTTHIKNLFCVNERVVVWLRTEFGRCALVMVGATNVGKITLGFAPDFQSNKLFSSEQSVVQFTQPKPIKKGSELGIFHLGSTVIMAYPQGLFLRGS